MRVSPFGGKERVLRGLARTTRAQSECDCLRPNPNHIALAWVSLDDSDMRFALALALFVCGSATNCLATAVPSGEGPSDDKPPPGTTRIGEREAQARQLLGAANVVGGLWRASVDRNNRRGLELLAWGTRLMRGTADTTAQRSTGDAGPKLGDLLVHLAGVRRSVRNRTRDAALSIRNGQAEAAVARLQAILEDVDEPNAQELARIKTLLALAHVGKDDLEVAVQAMDSAVGVACSVICAPDIRSDAGSG